MRRINASKGGRSDPTSMFYQGATSVVAKVIQEDWGDVPERRLQAHSMNVSTFQSPSTRILYATSQMCYSTCSS